MINQERVDQSYSYGYKIGKIAILTIDLYFKSVEEYRDFDALLIDSFPNYTMYFRGVSTNNKIIDVALQGDGKIKIIPNSNSGNFNLRMQIIFESKN